MRSLIFLLAMLAATQADAASLRTMTTLHSMNVYLRDLFDDAGKNADMLLGTGPDPGGRIVVEATQLNAIARQFDVAWRSVSPADRAVLEWPGRPLKREEAIEAVRTAITAAGAPDDWDIDIPGFSPPIVPFEGVSAPTVSQLDYDSNTGRFTAMLSITGEAMNPINVRIGGRVEAMAEAPVASTRLLPETVLRADDVHTARVRISQIRTQVATSVDQIIGMELKRPVPAGQPLRLADLTKPPLVQRGATVQVQLEVAGLSVNGQAVAMDAGAEGERIRVQNRNSRALLTAQVIGPGLVRVTPDELPTATTRYDRRTFGP
ncbi:flagellar basal body P-ring formation chaperone FlgA [Rhodopila sp.]|uniref:flagellar basal body P-ring formation chaperone FlgA n=1 Tax=Rhodopila sp. TaxID=2480087 RepID=UPI003D097E3E